jgi:hypothetical protein
MNIPTSIRIGAIDYTVSVVPKEANELNPHYCGRIDPSSQSITLLASGQQTMECNFIHEIVHGMLFTAGILSADHDEKLVEALANGLLMLVRDNPKLFEPEDGGEEDGEEGQG